MKIAKLFRPTYAIKVTDPRKSVRFIGTHECGSSASNYADDATSPACTSACVGGTAAIAESLHAYTITPPQTPTLIRSIDFGEFFFYFHICKYEKKKQKQKKEKQKIKKN